MSKVAAVPSHWKRSRRIISTTIFFVLIHSLAVASIVRLAVNFSWWTLGLGIAWYFICGMSITAGYHRLFAHRSYRAVWPVRLLLLCFGAASCQRSALKWSADHRNHHRHTDSETDPYAVAHGFWWAHIGWVLSDLPNEEHSLDRPPRDLMNDHLVRWQHRIWFPLAIVFGFVAPAAIGLLWGDALGAFLVAGPLRLVLTWHSTFSVNSFAHRFGHRPYSADASARDSFWVAFLTMGEGYHNFHHRFQTDYRNGVKWYHYDPTKWLVWTLSRIGVTRDLVRVPKQTIRNARRRAG